MAATYIPVPAFEVNDPQRLAATDLSRCVLLLTTGPAQWSYAVFDPSDRHFIKLKGYYFDSRNQATFKERMESCFAEGKMDFSTFSGVRVSFDTPAFTLVPSALFDASLLDKYFSFLHPPGPGQTLRYDPILPFKAVNVYAADSELHGYLKKKFPGARCYHADTAFLTSLLKEEDLSGERVYVRVRPGRMTLVILSANSLVMAQPYAIHHEMDCVYYIYNALRRLRLDVRAARIFLSGEIGEDSPVYKELRYEAPEVSWLKRPGSFNYVSAFKSYPRHHFYNLISLASCE